MPTHSSRSLRFAVAAILILITACASPETATPTAPSTGTVLEGNVVRHRDRAPVSGARVALVSDGVWGLTDALGRFEITTREPAGELRLTASASGFLDRAVIVRTPDPGGRIEFDMIQDAPPFSLDFYRRFARGVAPGESVAGATLRTWTMHPSFHVRSITDDTGEPVPLDLLIGIERLFRASVPALSGGRAHVQAFEVSADARAEQLGWVVVSFSRVPPPPRSPHASTDGVTHSGQNQGRIWIRYDPERPDGSLPQERLCGHRVLDVADHEIVHVMGFWHTSNWFDFRSANCDGASRTPPTLYHAAIAYSRPPFNLDPDLDVVRHAPFSTVALGGPMDRRSSRRRIAHDVR